MTYAAGGLAWSQAVEPDFVPWPGDDELETWWRRWTRGPAAALLLAVCSTLLLAGVAIALTLHHGSPAPDDTSLSDEDVLPGLAGAGVEAAPTPTPMPDVPDAAPVNPDSRYVALVAAGFLTAGNNMHVVDPVATAAMGHQLCAYLRQPGTTIGAAVAAFTPGLPVPTVDNAAAYVDAAVQVWGCGH